MVYVNQKVPFYFILCDLFYKSNWLILVAVFGQTEVKLVVKETFCKIYFWLMWNHWQKWERSSSRSLIFSCKQKKNVSFPSFYVCSMNYKTWCLSLLNGPLKMSLSSSQGTTTPLGAPRMWFSVGAVDLGAHFQSHLIFLGSQKILSRTRAQRGDVRRWPHSE